jgi:hypothetical protein
MDHGAVHAGARTVTRGAGDAPVLEVRRIAGVMKPV